MHTKGDWYFEKSDLTIRSDDFKNGSQMGDYKGVIVADLKPALGCDYSDNVDLEHTGRSHAVPQTLANGHLIAAAPDMYEALKSGLRIAEAHIHEEYDGVSYIGKLLARLEPLRKALAKAGGG